MALAYLQRVFDRILRLAPQKASSLEADHRMMAYFENNTSSRFSSRIKNLSPTMEKMFSSSVKKTCDETQSSAESQLARNCMLTMLDNIRQQDLKNMLSCFLAHNPEVLKVFLRGGPSFIETITVENTRISFHKMIATIVDEYEAHLEAGKKETRLINYKLNSDYSLAGVLVNVSDLDKETLKVFICDNSMVVIGKVTTPSGYGQMEKDIIELDYTKYDFNQATAEIMEEGTLRISYPIVYGEELERPMCMQLKIKQMGD